MLTDHETRPEHEAPRDGEAPRALDDAQKEFPVLEEPSWLEDDLDEEMEAPRDSAFRGIWIGVAAAAVTFALVFAVPHWLGWYDIGTPGRPARREPTPESVIATVTAKPSGGAPAGETSAEEPAQPAAAKAAAAAPATATPATATPPAAPRQVASKAAAPGPTAAVAKSTKPDRPAVAARSESKRTFAVQIAAFKNVRQANRLAARVKRDGYPADVLRVESSAVPWVVRIGGYSSREQAESARDALARKGLRGFIL